MTILRLDVVEWIARMTMILPKRSDDAGDGTGRKRKHETRNADIDTGPGLDLPADTLPNEATMTEMAIETESDGATEAKIESLTGAGRTSIE